MKVLIINDFASVVGGAERFLENLASERNDFVEFHRINIQDLVNEKNPVNFLQTKYRQIAVNSDLVRMLAEKIKAIDPAIIHLNNNNLYTNSVTRCLKKSKTTVACFIHDHCALKRLGRLFYPFFSNQFIFLTHCAEVYRQLLKIRRHVYLVKAPFDHAKWITPKDGISGNRLNDLLYVGRIEKAKGIFKLIEAVEIIKQKIPGITLTIIGEGSQRISLEKTVKEKNLADNVVLRGAQSDEDIKWYYCHSKLFIFPSVNETLGYVGLEAQSCGLPVIAFHNTGTNRWCQDNKNGFIVKGNSAEKLANKVLEIFYDDELLARVSQEAIRNVLLERYNTSQCKIADIYNTVLA